ncbi:hypothetical protein AK812_SmicGene47840, partial [Symbiodinium microadriaticum]
MIGWPIFSAKDGDVPVDGGVVDDSAVPEDGDVPEAPVEGDDVPE